MLLLCPYIKAVADLTPRAKCGDKLLLQVVEIAASFGSCVVASREETLNVSLDKIYSI